MSLAGTEKSQRKSSIHEKILRPIWTRRGGTTSSGSWGKKKRLYFRRKEKKLIPSSGKRTRLKYAEGEKNLSPRKAISKEKITHDAGGGDSCFLKREND